jgi:glycosyltransferase involved in cell wall biosynthesis
LVILLSAFACLPNYGTESGNGWNWAAHLVEAGHTVFVLTRAVNQERIEKYLADNPIENLHFLYVEVPLAKYVCDRKGGAYYVAWQLMALRAARKLARKIKLDVVHHITYGSVHIPTQLWRLGVPTIFGPVGGGQTTPDSLLPYFGASQTKERQRSFITNLLPYSPLHRSWMSRMSVVLATNGDTLDLVKKCGVQHAKFILDFGLPESFFVDQPRTASSLEGPVQLLWVGRILPRKGMALALDALQHVTHEYHLTIVGDGEGADNLPTLIRERGLEKTVTHLGRLPWDETRAQYLRNHCLYFTSLRDSTGAQMLEAMGCGLPVICLDLHGARDFVTEGTGFRVPVSDPGTTARALAEAINRYAALNGQQRAEMSRNALKRARSLEWHEKVQEMELIYADAISRSGRKKLNEIPSPSLTPTAATTSHHGTES